MDIEYLLEVVENPVLKKVTNKPLTETQIMELEKDFNNSKEFPKAFREFLFLAGDDNNFAFDDLGEGLNELQNIAQRDLKLARQEVKRPFFTFDVYDSQYSVIFLDETEEDPKVYLISPFMAKGGDAPLIQPNGWIFSKLVNESIRRVKYNIPF